MIWLLIALLLSCNREPEPDPGLTIDAIAKLVRSDVKDDEGWARDVREALVEAGQIPDARHVCQVLAIIEQESGYDADPAVPGLGDIVEKGLDEELAALGPLLGKGKEVLLDHVGPGQTKTFGKRLREVETERELDELFREIVAYHEGKAPSVGKIARFVFPRIEERMNPITTSGSMQVTVSFAQERGRAEGLDPEAVRDALYTREGGVRYGTARLFVHEAAYDKPVYRFADYNAGVYASRNAAFQAQLAELTGTELATDGDLLLWNDKGKPRREDGETMAALLAWRAASAPDLTESRLRSDVKHEKEAAFESTDTWARLRADWEQETGKTAPYAQLPNVALDSPKLAKSRTTKWFAEKVDERYRACLKR